MLQPAQGTYLIQGCSLGFDSVHRKIGRANLLRDTTCFALLHVCLADLFRTESDLGHSKLRGPHPIQQLCLSRVYVTQNAANWTA